MQFIQCLVTCYFHCLDAPKLAQAINKLLQKTVVPEFKSEVVHSLTEIFWSALEGTNSSSFNKIPSLLHNKMVGEAVGTELRRVFVGVASTLTLSLPPWKGPHAEAACRLGLTVKICIQLLQQYKVELTDAVWSEDVERDDSPERRSLTDIVSCLLCILSSQECHTESVMLAGTGLGMLLNLAPSPRTAIQHFWSLHRSLTSGTGGEFVMGKLWVENLFRTQDQKTEKLWYLGEIALIHGMIVSSSSTILLQSTSPSLQDFVKGEDSCLILELFPLVCLFCDGPTQQHYHSFLLLSQWFTKVLKLLPSILAFPDHAALTNQDSYVLEETLKRVWVHCDSPVEGVSEIIGEVFRSMLEVWAAEQANGRKGDEGLIERLSEKLLALPWFSRTKYKLFSLLLPHMALHELRGAMVVLSEQLLQCMGSNYLAPLAADFYKSSLLALGKRYAKDKQVCLWRELWEDTIVAGLLSDTPLQQTKVSEYWVPYTAKFLPPCCQILYRRLMTQLRGGEGDRDRLLYSWAVVARVYRATVGLGPGELESLSDYIEQALFSGDENTCSEAFSLLCDTVKKSEPISRLELELLKQGLPFCLKSDMAPFRQQLMADLNKLCIRIRDSCLAMLRARSSDEALGRSVEFVQWLHVLLLSSLGVGASFQRRRSALDLMSVVYDSLLYRPHHLTSIARKGKAQGSTEPLLKYAESRCLWNFFSPSTSVVLLHCILDGADDIQESSLRLLLKHFPSPLELSDSDCKGITTDAASQQTLCIPPASAALSAPLGPSIPSAQRVCHVLGEALRFSSSPKPHISQSGAHLCQLVFTKYVLEQGYVFRAEQAGASWHYSVLRVGDPEAAMSFLAIFLEYVAQSLKAAQLSTVQASKEFPIHGAMQAVIHCLGVYGRHRGTATPLPADWSSFIRSLLDISTRIVNMMMFILAGGADQGKCPSFAEMGMALQSLVSASQEDSPQSTAISPDFQFLLSWCWINLKMSCSCLGEMVGVVLEGGERPLSQADLQGVGQTFISVLTNCRHRGAIEGCRHGFLKFCTALLASDQSDLRSIPQRILSQILTNLQGNMMSTSVTRRSAGLPIILLCIIQAEKKNKESGLLGLAVKELLETSGQPVPDQTDLTTDLPQVHALNILKALFSDASLASSLMAHLAPAICLVIGGFESPSWAVRNSATQLFSTLMTRIFGQRSGGEATCNMMTLEELSVHYPELPPFMCAKLLVAVRDIGAVDTLHPSMFLVLTILASLSPRPLAAQPHSLEAEFMDCVKAACASPVYSVRELAARAFVALVPMETCLEMTLSLIQELSSPGNSNASNRMHGLTLSVEKLVLSRKWQEQEEVTLITALLGCDWLVKTGQCCPLVAAKLLQVVNHLCRHAIPPEEQRDALLALAQSCISSAARGQLKVGQGVLSVESVSLAFLLCQGRQADARALCHRCLSSSDTQVCSAYLSCLATHLSSLGPQARLPEELHATQGELWSYLSRESYFPSVSQAVQILTEMSLLQGREADFGVRLPQEASLDTLKAVLNHCGPESNLHQAVLPLQGLILRKQLQGQRIPDAELCRAVCDWSGRVLQAASPSSHPNSRMAAAHSLLVAAPLILSAAVTERASLEHAAVSLLAACLTLLEEEDADVRAVAARTVARLQWTSTPRQSSSRNVWMCIKLLLDYMGTEFWWSGLLLQLLCRQLYQPGRLPRLLQCRKPRVEHLFEEEDSFYAEPVLLLPFFHSTLLTIIQKQRAGDGHTSALEAAVNAEALGQDLQTSTDLLLQEAAAHHVFSQLTEGSVLLAARGLLLLSDICCRCLDLQPASHPDYHDLPSLLKAFRQIPFLETSPDCRHP